MQTESEPITKLPKQRAAGAPPLDRRTLVVFGASTVLLVAFWHWARPSPFRGSSLHEWVADRLGDGLTEFFDLLPYSYWGLTSLVLRVLVPLGVIVFVLRDSPRDYGFRFRGQLAHVRPYLIFYFAMVPILVLASSFESFQQTYPFYERAQEGGWHFWAFELSYGLQFLGIEAFFRGFMTFGLSRRFGFYAIPIMVIPYVMIHFGKPAPEVFAAIVAGSLLGYLALRAGSFMWGVAIHWAIALTMDVLVIAHVNGGLGGALQAIF